MLERNQILHELKSQLPFLRAQFQVKSIGLFGSFARNEATDESDIDFLVELTPAPEKYIQTKEALRRYLHTLFGRSIDLANPKSLKPHFRNRILKQVLYA